jgi:hypothetical protein
MAASDTTNRPLIEVGGGGDLQAPGRAGGINQLGDAGFNFQGLRVIVDANLPTNLGASTTEDTALVYRAADLYLWEGSPVMRAFPQTFAGNLEVLLQVYNYFAFTSERYSKAAAQVTGHRHDRTDLLGRLIVSGAAAMPRRPVLEAKEQQHGTRND